MAKQLMFDLFDPRFRVEYKDGSHLDSFMAPFGDKHKAVAEDCCADYRAPVPVQRQDDDYQCGSACFAAVCRHFGIHAFSPDMARQLGTTPADGTAAEAMMAMAKRLGMNAVGQTGMTLDSLDAALDGGSPIIVSLDRWGGSHWAVVVDCDDETVSLMDPASGYDALPIDDFLKRWELDAGRYGIVVSGGLVEGEGTCKPGPANRPRPATSGVCNMAVDEKLMAAAEAEFDRDLDTQITSWGEALLKELEAKGPPDEPEPPEPVSSKEGAA